MAPVVPNPKKIKSFRPQAAFETGLAANHARETDLWSKVHKKVRVWRSDYFFGTIFSTRPFSLSVSR
jgi:hypothetical protein